MDKFVWSKMKKYSAWPSKICQTVPDHIPKPKQIENRHCVYFYGTNNYAWISKDNLKNYSEYKSIFETKNKTKSFRKALEEIDEAIKIENESNHFALKNIPKEQIEEANQIEIGFSQITLKDVPNEEIEEANRIEKGITNIKLKNTPIEDIISTFDEHFAIMEDIFTSRSKIDRFNFGGFGVCSVMTLDRLLTSEQQKQMYQRIVEAFTNNRIEYMGNRIHENLFWSMILPQWAIAICMKKYSMSKAAIVDQIKQDSDDSLNRSSFDISF